MYQKEWSIRLRTVCGIDRKAHNYCVPPLRQILIKRKGEIMKFVKVKALVLTTPKNIKNLMKTQFAKPEGKAGQFFTLAMNVVNFKLYNAVYNFVPKNHGEKILDVGFGNGDMLKRLEEKLDALFYGIDISEDMKILATKANAKAVATEKMFLSVGDVEDMSYEDSFFDCVYTINTVYFWKDADKAMSQIARVLSDGGRFICAFYSKAYFERSESYQFEGETYYTPKELKELVQKHGFENVKIKVVDEKRFMYCLVAEKRGNGVDADNSDE